MKLNALVIGGGGFIGNHMVKRLKKEGYVVTALDLKLPEYDESAADRFIEGDARSESLLEGILSIDGEPVFDEIYQFAADMGGAGYIFSGDNDANVMLNSAGINISLINSLVRASEHGNFKFPRVFYSSSACIYPQELQVDAKRVDLSEEFAYPANPDSEYGWEKLFSERLYLSFERNYGCNVRVARFHNVYGPLGTFTGGREKAPAAVCRKVAEAPDNGEIEIWGSGEQTRSFLYIDDCIEAVRRFMVQDAFSGPMNIGSEEMVSIRELVRMVSKVAGKEISVKSVPGPTGVAGRNSNNDLVRRVLDWDYSTSLEVGLEATYSWIKMQMSDNSH